MALDLKWNQNPWFTNLSETTFFYRTSSPSFPLWGLLSRCPSRSRFWQVHLNRKDLGLWKRTTQTNHAHRQCICSVPYGLYLTKYLNPLLRNALTKKLLAIESLLQFLNLKYAMKIALVRPFRMDWSVNVLGNVWIASYPNSFWLFPKTGRRLKRKNWVRLEREKVIKGREVNQIASR